VDTGSITDESFGNASSSIVTLEIHTPAGHAALTEEALERHMRAAASAPPPDKLGAVHLWVSTEALHGSSNDASSQGAAGWSAFFQTSPTAAPRPAALEPAPSSPTRPAAHDLMPPASPGPAVTELRTFLSPTVTFSPRTVAPAAQQEMAFSTMVVQSVPETPGAAAAKHPAPMQGAPHRRADPPVLA